MTIKYRVWEVENPPNEPEYYPVTDIVQAVNVIKREIRNNKVWSVWGDAFGLEVDEGFGWEEWYNENGEDILEAYGL